MNFCSIASGAHTMSNPDEASRNESSNLNKMGHGSSFICSINQIASGKSNWLRSIPQHIRKFISKSNKSIGLGSSGKQNALESVYENGNVNASDEFNSCSMIEYRFPYAEEAMAQMSK